MRCQCGSLRSDSSPSYNQNSVQKGETIEIPKKLRGPESIADMSAHKHPRKAL